MPAPRITFRRVTAADFALLATWLSAPHVSRWWNHEVTPEAIDRDFGLTARGEEPNQDLLALLADDGPGGRPIGLLQRCFWHDYPEYVDEVAHILTIPTDAVTIDYLIGEPADTGRGLGPAMIEAAVADTWRNLPGANSIIVPVVAGNRPSWRALEKAGFRRIAEGDLAPDNPIDPPEHLIYRVDRPPTSC